MSKGLKVSLVTVAIALMGMSAMATAPVISDIPDPIVGDGETATPSNEFVYPDAINLNFYVQDDGGIENVVWSYEVAGSQIYSINGTDPIDSGSEDPTDPAAVGKDLGTVRNGEDDPDTAANTITIRNVNLSPIGGPNTDPGAAGIVSSETQVVTLYASDGSTYSQTEIMVYTDNDGLDRLSTTGGGVQEYQADFTNNSHGYTTMEFGSATVSVTGNGICIEVAAGNTNIGQWTSPYPLFEMMGNSVYNVRAGVNGSQTTAGLVPLWDIIVQNFDSADGVGGANAYLADYLFLDNEGGADAVGPSVGLDSVDLWFVPLPAKFPAWNDPSTGAFSATNDGMNDIQVIFRILDADETGGYGGQLDVGQVCVQNITIDRYDLNTQVTEGDTVMDLAINQTNFRAFDLIGGSTFDWGTAGELTFGPSGANYTTEITAVWPGDGDHLGVGGTGAAEDDYPFVWESDTIYMVEVEVSAPTAADDAQPSDVIRVGLAPPSWECFMLNYVTRGDSTMHNLGMPKSGSTQTYVTFFNSHQESLSAQSDFHRLTTWVDVLNADGLVFNGQTGNSADMTIHGITVKKVTIQ